MTRARVTVYSVAEEGEIKYYERDHRSYWVGFFLGWGMGLLYAVVLTVVFKP
jgi:hypothetical protein